MSQKFPKQEKLKSQKTIEQLFLEGKSVSVFPLKLVYLKTSFSDDVFIKTGVSVGKRQFKTAVARNRIKRLIREAYRLNKAHYFNNMSTQYAFMILYLGKEIPSFANIESKMKLLLEKVLDKISE